MTPPRRIRRRDVMRIRNSANRVMEFGFLLPCHFSLSTFILFIIEILFFSFPSFVGGSRQPPPPPYREPPRPSPGMGGGGGRGPSPYRASPAPTMTPSPGRSTSTPPRPSPVRYEMSVQQQQFDEPLPTAFDGREDTSRRSRRNLRLVNIRSLSCS